jgi:Aspartyl protease/PDZ domain
MARLIRLIVPILAILLATQSLQARGETPPPAPPADDVLERFVVSRDCPLLLLPVELNGKKYQFALDTGATQSVYDSSLRSMLGPPIRTTDVSTPGGTATVALYKAPDAKLGRLHLPEGSPIAVADLQRLREITGEEIFGMIGMDFLAHHIFRIDPDRGEVVFLRVPGDDPGRRVPVALDDTDGGVPMIEVQFEGMKAAERFMVDTGFGGFDSGDLRPEAFDALDRQGKLKADGDSLSTTLSGTAREHKGALSEFSLGGYRHRHLVFDRGNVNFLGLNYWLRYVVTFDLPAGAMYLKKSARFDAPDLRDMGGMHLDLIAGRVHVHSVEKRSPAESVGIHPEDTIVRIQGENAECMQLQRLRRLLCVEGTTITLSVNRGKGERTVRLELRDWKKCSIPDGKQCK